jgi:tripartite-type tricarboxylate transporter receptor subunit TctC
VKLSRRKLLYCCTAAVPALRAASAADYPTRPVRWIVGFPPGGSNDITARIMAQPLSERLHQPFVVVNRPGASSNVATAEVAMARPDGYTLMELANVNAINAALYDDINYDFIRDIALVAGIAQGPEVMSVNPAVPSATVPEFIAYAKANPGKINMASPGNGSLPHIAGELLMMMTGINMVHVPYHGEAPALVDLIGGQVQLMFNPIQSSIGFIRSGKLRPLAVTTTRRADALPNVPTLGEFIQGFEVSSWQGLGAPKGTPPEIIDLLNNEVNAALAKQTVKTRLADLGIMPMPMSPDACQKFIADETEKWSKVIRAANIKAD